MCKIKTSFRKRISSSGKGCGFRKFPHPLTQIYCYGFVVSIKYYRIIRQNANDVICVDTNKCSVYNDFSIRYLEVHIMDGEKEEYRKKIIEMVNKIENVRYLKFIYDLFISFKNKWGI